MALDDIFVLDHFQTFLSEPVHNIYTINRLGTGVAIDLCNAFIEDVLPSILALQTNDMVTVSIKAYSLGDLADLNEVAVGETGVYGPDDMLPVFNAINYTFKPTSRAVRPGSKRISGIPEGAQDKGTIENAPYLALIETLRVAYGNEMSVDDTNFWQFVVVKRVPYDVPDSDPVRTAYRFPETDEELVFAPLRVVTTTPKISHQVSRGN